MRICSNSRRIDLQRLDFTGHELQKAKEILDVETPFPPCYVPQRPGDDVEFNPSGQHTSMKLDVCGSLKH